MTAARSWTPDQLAAITERRAELVVSAAAGSGKTAVLIERVCRAALGQVSDAGGEGQLDAGTAVGLDRMLVVTFTNAAAAELRARLTAALNVAYRRAAEQGNDAPALIREQLAALPRAQISTFHSFCADVVRRYGHLAGISYDRVLAEDESSLLAHELATRFLDERLGDPAAADERRLAMAWGGSDGVGAADLSRMRFSRGLRRELLALLDFQRAQPDPQAWYRRHVTFGADEFPALDGAHFDPAHPLMQQLNTSLAAWRDWLIDGLQDLAGQLARDHPNAVFVELARRLVARLENLSLDLGWCEAAEYIEVQLKEKQLEFDHNPRLLEAYRRDIPKGDPWYERLKSDHGRLTKRLKDWQDLFGQPWAEVALIENETRGLLDVLWRLAREFEQQYRDYKQRRSAVDFDDMQLLALSLLAARRDDGSLARDADGNLVPSEVALELRRRFEAVLVDEYQDTNEVQEAIINLVTRSAPSGPAGGGRPRFSVGDLKQSIYTFRLAVPQLFSAARERLEALDDGVGRVIKLQVNFRSRPRILAAINHIFNGLLTPALGGEDYTQNQLVPPETAATETEPPAQPADAELRLVVTGQTQPESPAGGSSAEGAEEDGDPGPLEAVYSHLAQVLIELHGDAARPVRDRAGGRRPAQWRDMAVLMRTTAGRIETLLSVCARAGVPVYAPGRSGFYARPEVADALALLNVVDNPRRDIPLAAVLSGPAVGLTYAQLVTVARTPDPGATGANGASVDLWQRLLWYCDGGEDRALVDLLLQFRRRLRGWRDSARLDSLPELLWRIYADTGLLASAAALSGGEQRVANLYRLHDLTRLARDAEHRGLTQFLRGLELSRRAAGDLGEAPLLTEAQDVVRVMTVHQAKGQEFPVVVVPDLDKGFNFQDLNADVLWHRAAGAGGRWVRWPAPVPNATAAEGAAGTPRRLDTLGYRICKEAKERDIVSEELRILYVALTRARDRLVLIGAATRQEVEQLPTAHRGERAKCWLDWIGPQLQAGIERARETGEPAVCGPADCWQVSMQTAGAAPALRRVPRKAEPLGDEQLTAIRRRLTQAAGRDLRPGLPLKLTVTRLVHPTASPDGEDDAMVAEAAAPPPPRPDCPLPAFVSAMRQPAAAAPTAVEIGTAAHQLLAKLDLRREYQSEEITRLLSKLGEEGSLQPAVAEALGPAQLAQAAAQLRESLGLAEAELYAELPVALLVPATDGGLQDQLARAGLLVSPSTDLAADDAVYVQGVIDLLAVRQDTATVVDYKTDRGATAEDLTARYGAQLGWYCRAVAALLPRHQVRWAIYGLDGAGLLGPVAWPD